MLYRKYRPQTFSEVVGQDHVVRTLAGALTSGRIGHAYLFAGPRGTGKTTIARVFAKALNCAKRAKDGNPCDACESCSAIAAGRSLDLIEIDAASNRGIDEIRSVKESAGVAAPSGGYKIFLIDEAHMLTKEAFNALLKVLEEPPAQAIFILATTEPHKVLPTVLSRVQRFHFRKLALRDIAQKLKEIAAAEKTTITDGALIALAASADGALRDAEVALSKVMAGMPGNRRIDEAAVQEALGLIPLHYYPELLDAITARNRVGALELVQAIFAAGADPDHFSKEFLEYLRKVLLTRVNPAILASVGQELTGEYGATLAGFAQRLDPKEVMRIMAAFTQARTELKHSPVAQLPLELAIMELTTEN